MRARCVDGWFLIRLEDGKEAMASLRLWAAEQKVELSALNEKTRLTASAPLSELHRGG